MDHHEARALLALVMCGVIPAAHAQATDHTAGPTEEIVVNGFYVSAESKSALKLDVPVRDIPFTTTNYSDDFMKALETTNVADMYKYMTGVQRAGNTGFDISIRGFKSAVSDRNAIMVDGMPGLPGRFGSPSTVATSHIEVVKGPMSVLYGQAQPGGFVNIVTKKPQDKFSGSAELRGTGYQGDGLNFGSSLGEHASLDLTGPIDAERKFLYRMIVDQGDANSFQDFSKLRETYFSPSFTWKVSSSTSLDLALEYRQRKEVANSYLPAPNRDASLLPERTNHYQQPTDLLSERGNSATVRLNHWFNDEWELNAAYRGVTDVDSTVTYQNNAIRAAAAGAQPSTLGRRLLRQDNVRRYDYLDTSIAGKFETGGIKHQMLAGLNGGRDYSDFNILQNFIAPAPSNALCDATFSSTLTRSQCSLDISIYNPRYDVNVAGNPILNYSALPPGTNLTRRHFTNESSGAYISDLLTLTEHWKINAGLRYSRDKQTLEERKLAGVPTLERHVQSTVPMAGLLYQPSKDITYYLSYSQSFVPPNASAIPLVGATLVPEQGRQAEVGAKANMFDNKVVSTFSIFRIDHKNAFNTVGMTPGPITNAPGTCTNTTCTTQNGLERSQGAEVEINYRATDNWQTIFGYTYLNTKILETTELAQLGMPLQSAPRHSAHLWSRYDFTAGALNGFGMGVGLAYSARRVGIEPTTANPVTFYMPGYTVADLALFYHRGKYSATLKTSNLFNKNYIETGGFSGETQIQPGAVRQITLAVGVDF